MSKLSLKKFPKKIFQAYLFKGGSIAQKECNACYNISIGTL